ncbi:hypothetical protein [Lysobacter sp. CA196]|uniref:hypothetical protein n=1 Tax=Lysobacter sp. CA196 TaxID=3455606 RepID=UPI003F8D15E5
MYKKISRWFYALFTLSIFARCVFYVGIKLYLGEPISGTDAAVAGGIGAVSLYLSYMFFSKIFERADAGCSLPNED